MWYLLLSEWSVVERERETQHLWDLIRKATKHYHGTGDNLGMKDMGLQTRIPLCLVIFLLYGAIGFAWFPKFQPKFRLLSNTQRFLKRLPGCNRRECKSSAEEEDDDKYRLSLIPKAPANSKLPTPRRIGSVSGVLTEGRGGRRDLLPKSASPDLKLATVSKPSSPVEKRRRGRRSYASKYSPAKRHMRIGLPIAADDACRAEDMDATEAEAGFGTGGIKLGKIAAKKSLSAGGQSLIYLAAQASFSSDEVVSSFSKLLQDNEQKQNIKEKRLAWSIGRNNRPPVSLGQCNAIIKALGNRGCFNACDSILALMRKHGINCSVVTYSTLISRAASWQQPRLAERYFGLMRADVEQGVSVHLDEMPYNSLINAYAKSAINKRGNNKIWRDSNVGNSGRQSSARSLTSKAGEQFEFPFNCLHNSTVVAKTTSLNGDSAVSHALSVMRQMERDGIPPSLITFNTLMDCCAREADLSSARAVMEMMHARGLRPDALTYSSLLHAHCQAGEIDAATEVLHEMEEQGLQPTVVTYSLLLHALGRNGQLDKAFAVLDTMRAQGATPNIVTLSSLIDACGRYSKLDRAFELFDSMCVQAASMGGVGAAKHRPNSITCSSLVDACLKARSMDRAMQVLRYMRQQRLPLTEVTYTSLITELTRLGLVSVALPF